MPPWMRSAASWAASQVPTLLTLALLGGIFAWGALHEWKIGPAAGGESPGPAESAPESEVVSVPLATALDPALADDKLAAPALGTKIVGCVGIPSGCGPLLAASDLAPLGAVKLPSEDAVRQTGIRTAPAETRAMAHHVTAYGSVDYEPGYYAELAPRAPGTVWSVEKELAQPARQGEALALIESAQVGQAKADFLQSLTQLEVRRQTVQRLESAGGSVPGAARLEAEANLREARIRLFNDHQRLLNLGLPVRLKDLDGLSEEERVRRLRLVGLAEPVRQRYDPETLTANLLPLTMPFDGVVVTRKAAPGEVVGTTQILFTVADTRHLHIDLDVHPEDMVYVREGQTVTFRPDKQEIPPAEGTVAHISPEVNEKTRTVQIHTKVENPDGRLRPHTFGTGRILVEERPNAVVVPTEAVQASRPDEFLVFVRRSAEVFVARPVRRGLHDEAFTEVIGVKPGEVVATAGSYALKSQLLRGEITGGD